MKKLKISETRSLFHNVGHKNSVYYVNDTVIKTIEELQQGVDERERVEKAG